MKINSISFADLLEIYANTVFDEDGGGILSIVSPKVLEVITKIDSDPTAGQDSNIAVMDEIDNLSVGDKIQISVKSPKISLGYLVRTFDDLLKVPEAGYKEPSSYFIIDGKIHNRQSSVDIRLKIYRSTLEVIAILMQSSTYLDQIRQELVIFRNNKVTIPIRYRETDLIKMPRDAAERLRTTFSDGIHDDQKLEMLADAMCKMCEFQPALERMPYLLNNLDELAERVSQGYKLFASNFSYSKVKDDFETAKLDFVGRIHKTVSDIQAQLLAIPIATLVVASQMKETKVCGVEAWTNVAVVSGAWIFYFLLLIALINQILTLNTIHEEVSRQKSKLINEYDPIGLGFASIFDTVFSRIKWHRKAIVSVGILGFLGASFATLVFHRINAIDLRNCLNL